MFATLTCVPIREAAPPWSEVADLVIRAREGDREALGELVERFEKTVHALSLRRLGNAAEAAELTQEVFLHMVRRIHQLREPERFAGWLRQMTVRMAINRATRRPQAAALETEVLETLGETRAEPSEELARRERIERVRDALDRLKPLDRDVLQAFYLREMSLVEIAETFDVPVGTVKRRLHVARHRLREALDGDLDLFDDDRDRDRETRAETDAELLAGCPA